MTRREEQAWNDGRLAFRDGLDIGKNPRRGSKQRAAWFNGFEHERRLDLAQKITPEQRAESASVAGRLKDWVRQQRAKEIESRGGVTPHDP